MAPPSPAGEALPLLSSGRRGRQRNASFESGFPAVVSGPEPSGELDERPQAKQAAPEREEPSRLRGWLHESALTLTLVMSAVGAGTLAVPYTFVLLPPLPALATLVVVGCAMFFTADAILRVHVAVALAATAAPREERHKTYQALALAAGGSRLANLAGALTAFAVFGACVGCVRVVRDMAPSLLATALSFLGEEDTTPSNALVIATVCVVVTAVVLPLAFSRDISALRFSSYLGFIFSLYLVAAVAFRALSSSHSNQQRYNAASTPEEGSSLLWRLAEVVGIYNFTFMLHLNVIPLLAQLVATETKRLEQLHPAESYNSVTITAIAEEEREDHGYRRALCKSERVMRTRLAVAIAACVAIYAVFGLCAASIYGAETKGNILLNLDLDPIMAVPRIAILFTILFSFPLLFHPLRALVFELGESLWPRQEETRSAATSISMTLAVSVGLLGAQILCALQVPGIQVVFSFVGASILLVLCYLLPAAFYGQLFPWRATHVGTFRLAGLIALAIIAGVFCSLATAELMW